jgi:hypothetical protein
MPAQPTPDYSPDLTQADGKVSDVTDNSALCSRRHRVSAARPKLRTDARQGHARRR